MRLGILIPTRGVVMQSAERPPVEECWAMAREADQAGLDAVWVGDSVVAKPRLEALTTLAYIAGITSRVRLGTAVLLPALRQPIILAQLITNVDQISRGRLIVGVGVGWSLPSAEREWAACGMDHRRRVRHLEDQLMLWRELWRGEPLTSEGPTYALAEHTIGPLPWRPEGPPIFITVGNRGQVLPAQLDRFARLGDGIITTYVTPEQCLALREQAAAALEARVRTEPDFALCVYTTVRLDDDVAQAERVTTEFLVKYYGGDVRERGRMGLGPPEETIRMLEEYAAAGVTDLCIRFSGEDQRDQLDRFIRDVWPAFAPAGEAQAVGR